MGTAYMSMENDTAFFRYFGVRVVFLRVELRHYMPSSGECRKEKEKRG